MAEIPEGAKRPTDRKTKNADRFSFEHAGETYTFKPTYDVVTPGFLRANRRRDEVDAFFTMLEALVDDEDDNGNSATLAVIDNMTQPQFKRLQKDFYSYLEVSGAGE